MENKDAIKLFLKKEFTALRGRRNFNLWVLSGIFFVSILVIGFGDASMSYLRYKMDDPFVNWVDINLQQEKQKNSYGWEEPQNYLQNGTVQQKFNFKYPQPGHIEYRSFRKKDNTDQQFDGRSIVAFNLGLDGKKMSNPILDKILEKRNVVGKSPLPFDDDGYGIIITQEMANALGYSEAPAFVTVSEPQDSFMVEQVELAEADGVDGYFPVNIPVVAVVKQLPSMMSYLYSNRWAAEHSGRDAFSLVLDENNQSLQLCGDERYLSELQKNAQDKGFEAVIKPYFKSWKSMSCLEITCQDYGEERTRKYNELMADLNPDMSRCTRVYEFRKPLAEEWDPMFYSVYMGKLDSIRAFSEDLRDQCGLKLEMTNVEAKENFFFVQRMGMVLSGSVIVIVALFILVFIYFMLQSHFQKIQRNLGTFKAFGVDNRTLNIIYTRLILRIVGIAFVLGAVVAALVSGIWSLISDIEHGYPWVNVFSWWNLLLLLLAVLAAIVATLLVSSRMLKKSPGDLIYDRI